MESELKKNITGNPNGDFPDISGRAFIDPTARVIGNVRISAGCFVGPYAVIRADEADPSGQVWPITIGADSNVQDGVIIHALAGTSVTIEACCSIAHGAVIHGPCQIGEGSFVGFRAVVYKSHLEREVFVGASAVVQNVNLMCGDSVDAGISLLWQQDVATLASKVTPDQRQFMTNVIAANRILVKGYNKGDR